MIYSFGNDWTATHHRAYAIEVEHEKSEQADIDNLVIEVYKMITEMSKKIEKIEEQFEVIKKIKHGEKDVNTLNEVVIDLQNHMDSNHDKFMQYVDEKFEKMMNTMFAMIKNTDGFENDDDGETTTIKESEQSIGENYENEGVEETTSEELLIEEGDNVEYDKTFKDYLDEYVKGDWSIEEYIDAQENFGVDLS